MLEELKLELESLSEVLKCSATTTQLWMKYITEITNVVCKLIEIEDYVNNLNKKGLMKSV